MEEAENQLPESGVYLMNTVEAFRKVRALQARKIRNEQKVPREQLEGRYKASYEKLINDIREAQMEYRAAYTRSIRKAAEYLSMLILTEPTDAGIDERCEIAMRKNAEGGGDPLLLKILTEVDCLLDEEVIRDGEEDK